MTNIILWFVVGALVGGCAVHIYYRKKWQEAVATVRELRLETARLKERVDIMCRLCELEDDAPKRKPHFYTSDKDLDDTCGLLDE